MYQRCTRHAHAMTLASEIAAFLDRNLWIKQSRAPFVECLKLLKAIKVETIFERNDVLPKMTNNHASGTR
jgi:hypothetical protein